MNKEDLSKDRKIKALYKDHQENGIEELERNQEYIEASKACLEALDTLKKDMSKEKMKQLLNYDDKAVEMQSFLLEAYYRQGYMDARN